MSLGMCVPLKNKKTRHKTIRHWIEHALACLAARWRIYNLIKNRNIEINTNLYKQNKKYFLYIYIYIYIPH